MKRKAPKTIHITGEDGLDQLHEEIEGLILQPVDEANFTARPSEAGETYGEKFFDHRRSEQLDLFAADAEAMCRPHREAAAAATAAADDERILIDHHLPTLAVWRRFEELSNLMVGTITRSHKERLLYYLRMLLLLVGDVVAVAGGMITLGELPSLAIVQAVAAGVAAITSGLLAAEIKKARQARERHQDEDSLSDLQLQHRQLYRGPDDGEYMVKLVMGGGLLIVTLIGIGIFMLRSTTEGTATGMVFACIAIAVALASWANTYCYTDEWRDVLDVAYEQATRNTRDHQRLTAAPARAELASHEASIASIESEYGHRGKAAAARFEAEKNDWLTKFPGVVGHGPKVTRPTTKLPSDQKKIRTNSPEPAHNGSGAPGSSS